jgi:hypothetical protein
MFTVTNNTLDANYTCLQAEVSLPALATFQLLGEPLDGDGEKVTVEWILEDDRGHIATLYDWKASPCASSQRDSLESFTFHIGGHDSMTASKFKDWLIKNLR